MTRRVSKREMLHRLDSVPYARIHLDNLRSKSACATVDGVLCEVNFPRKARNELIRESGVYGNVDSIPAAIGNGYMPPGTNPENYARGRRRSQAALPVIKIYDSFSLQQELRFESFQKKHPIGEIINGRIVLVNRRVAILDLGLGQQGRLDCGNSLDYTLGSPIKWLQLPQVGAYVDVLVRGFNQSTQVVDVSLHSFRSDNGFCNQSSGYRSGFKVETACFRELPWEKKPC